MGSRRVAICRGDRALFVALEPELRRSEAVARRSCCYNKWYVDEIYDFLFVNGHVEARRAAAGRVRPQRGGWRRERRGLADAVQLAG